MISFPKSVAIANTFCNNLYKVGGRRKFLNVSFDGVSVMKSGLNEIIRSFPPTRRAHFSNHLIGITNLQNSVESQI